jgi:hypothetical protein
MSRKQIEDLKREHAEHLSGELNKFLEAYNDVSNVKISYEKNDYPNVIKQLGYYLFGLENDSYLDSTFVIRNDDDNDDAVVINMSLFKQTQYEQKAYNFIKSLKEMFNIKNNIDISSILSNFPDFTDDQVTACHEFYQKLNELTSAMHRSIFNNNENVRNVVDHASISKYQDELKKFNEYTMRISSNMDNAKAVQLFNDAIQQYLLQKQHVKIFFDA